MDWSCWACCDGVAEGCVANHGNKLIEGPPETIWPLLQAVLQANSGPALQSLKRHLPNTLCITPQVQLRRLLQLHGGRRRRKVDREQGNVTLKHDPIASLDVPRMTMVIKVMDSEVPDAVNQGIRSSSPPAMSVAPRLAFVRHFRWLDMTLGEIRRGAVFGHRQGVPSARLLAARRHFHASAG